MLHQKVTQMLAEKKKFDIMVASRRLEDDILNSLMKLISHEIRWEIKNSIPGWNIEALFLTDQDRITIEVTNQAHAKDETRYRVVGYHSNDNPYLGIYVTKRDARPWEVPEKIVTARLKAGQIITTTIDTQYSDRAAWSGYGAFERLYKIQTLLQALDNSVWEGLELQIKQKLKEYTDNSIFETKQCVRLILAHWTDIDCTLASFPKDIVRLICMMALKQSIRS